jgi:hypothetical protein
MKVKAL